MTTPPPVPTSGPMVMGQEAYDAEVERLKKAHTESGGGMVGPRVTSSDEPAPADPAEPAESLSYSDAMELLDKAPEELGRVVALELVRLPTPRKSVLQVAARKARAAENDALLAQIEAALEALS